MGHLYRHPENNTASNLCGSFNSSTNSRALSQIDWRFSVGDALSPVGMVGGTSANPIQITRCR
jgi:hypothetical protein